MCESVGSVSTPACEYQRVLGDMYACTSVSIKFVCMICCVYPCVCPLGVGCLSVYLLLDVSVSLYICGSVCLYVSVVCFCISPCLVGQYICMSLSLYVSACMSLCASMCAHLCVSHIVVHL